MPVACQRKIKTPRRRRIGTGSAAFRQRNVSTIPAIRSQPIDQGNRNVNDRFQSAAP